VTSPARGDGTRVLVHLATGIGNIVLATPLLVALSRRFRVIDLRLDADYPGAGDLFRGWSAVRAVYDTDTDDVRSGGAYDIIVPAIPPFAWSRFAARYRHCAGVMARPPETLFYANEQSYYMDFARRLGCDGEPASHPFIPAPPAPDIGAQTLVLAPGCKTGVMAAKRWLGYPALAEHFDDVVIVGTADDLRRHDGAAMAFPAHVRSLVGRQSLRELAGVLAAAGVVVANDSGIGHLAAAVGATTLLIFGPTPDATLGSLPPNAAVLRAGLACEPCWFTARFVACGGTIDCLGRISVAEVAAAVRAPLMPDAA
jgi:ADP-heptose:LPS heptosyltransferase